MRLLIAVLAILLLLSLLLGGVGALPFLLMAVLVVAGAFIIVRAIRGRRIAPR